MRRRARALFLVSSSLVLAGCEARTRVGDLSNGFGGAAMLPEVGPEPPFSFPDGVAGTWTGHFEGYRLPSGSDAVTLSLDQAADGTSQIYIVFGTDPPPAPPSTAAEVWVPARYVYPSACRQFMGPFDGFLYRAHGVQWRDRRLTFAIASLEAWQSWCVLQTPFPHPYSGWPWNLCAPVDSDCSVCVSHPAPVGSTTCRPSPRNGATVSCAQFWCCTNLVDGASNCLCDTVRCEADPTPNHLFDITFDPGNLTASGTSLSQPATLRFTR